MQKDLFIKAELYLLSFTEQKLVTVLYFESLNQYIKVITSMFVMESIIEKTLC
jgi:hypothetical protein